MKIELTYPIFHVAGLSSRGSFIIDNKGLVVPDFSCVGIWRDGEGPGHDALLTA